jgi:hypothetical protein
MTRNRVVCFGNVSCVTLVADSDFFALAFEDTTLKSIVQASAITVKML